MAAPVGDLVFRAYFVGSDAVRDAGLLGAFPKWYAPAYDSPAITERNLFHPDWIEPILVLLAIAVIGLVSKYTLGYLLFRVTSDFERLPYPMAPVAAQGSMALAEESDTVNDPSTGENSKTPVKKDDRWRRFSLGAYMGIGFGLLQIGIPAIHRHLSGEARVPAAAAVRGFNDHDAVHPASHGDGRRVGPRHRAARFRAAVLGGGRDVYRHHSDGGDATFSSTGRVSCTRGSQGWTRSTQPSQTTGISG